MSVTVYIAIATMALTAGVYYLLVVAIIPCNAATLTTNINGEACQGETWTLTCTGRSPTHRWTLEIEGSQSNIDATMMTYTAGRSVAGSSHIMGSYNFTLVSASTNRFKSIVSTVLIPALNNTVAKCIDTQSEAQPVTIRIAAPPSPPQALTSRVLESDTNYSTVEVTWEPPNNDSIVDFYHFKVVAESEGTNHTLYTVETPNTTVIVSIFAYNVNITVFLSATDNCGTRSVPAVLFVNYIGSDTIDLDDVLDPDTVAPTSNFDTIKPSDSIVIPSSATKFSTSTSIPSQKKSQTLLISISTLSGAIILSLLLIIICLAITLKHIVQSETLSATCSSDSVNVYAELESSFPHGSDAVEGESQFSAPNESEDEQDVPGVYERISIQGLNA